MLTEAWINVATLIEVGDNTRSVALIGDAPIFELLDHRVSISCESHLPLASSIQVVDNKEKLDRKIVERFFASPLETSVSFASNGRFDSSELSRRIFSGLTSFVKKSDRDIAWYRLLSPVNLRFFRFHLYATYRKYDQATNTWSLDKKRMTINDNKFWEMELSFISDV